MADTCMINRIRYVEGERRVEEERNEYVRANTGDVRERGRESGDQSSILQCMIFLLVYDRCDFTCMRELEIS
jgi:hypothetical protein